MQINIHIQMTSWPVQFWSFSLLRNTSLTCMPCRSGWDRPAGHGRGIVVHAVEGHVASGGTQRERAVLRGLGKEHRGERGAGTRECGDLNYRPFSRAAEIRLCSFISGCFRELRALCWVLTEAVAVLRRGCFRQVSARGLQTPVCNVAPSLATSVLVCGDFPLLDAELYSRVGMASADCLFQ